MFVYCVSVCFTNAFHPLRQLNFGSNREKTIKVNGVDSMLHVTCQYEVQQKNSVGV